LEAAFLFSRQSRIRRKCREQLAFRGSFRLAAARPRGHHFTFNSDATGGSATTSALNQSRPQAAKNRPSE